MRKFAKYLILAAVAVFAMASCETKEEPEIALKSISVNPATLSLKVGATATLTVQYTPEDATSKPEAEWKSSNPAIATVERGVVTAVAAGEATITATVENLTATAAVTVTTDEVPEDLSGAWSVIGKFNEWSGDVEMIPDNDGWYKAENVELVNVTNTNDGFKFRRDKDWSVNLGLDGDAAVVDLDKEIPLAKNGGNICLAKDAVYNLYLNPNAKVAKIVFVKDLAPANFDSPAWDDVPGVSNGTHGMFKFTRDENYAYFYTWRTREGRFDALWGDGQGYIYFAMDLDGDETNGESLNGNGPYDYIGYIYCFGGTADAPEIRITAAGDCRPSDYTVDNIIAQGKVNEEGAFVEYRVPLADLPKLPENFTITSWGNKDLSKVVYYVGEQPDTWDYAPSAEYLAEDNLWKAVDQANSVSWFYCPNWDWDNQPAAPETSFKESTYVINIKEADDALEWTSQMWIKPTNELLLDVTKTYTFTAKVHSTTGTRVYFKMYQDGVDWPFSFETATGENRIEIAPGETKEIKVENFIPLETPQMLLIDFAHHAADNIVHVKDITLKATGEAPKPVSWDYTPSEEYLADNNLWKVKAFGNEMYYYYHCTGTDWNGVDTVTGEVPFLSKEQSTYVLDYADNTGSQWQNQFFVWPAEGHEIALSADKTYKLKVTLGSDKRAPAFFKIEKENPENAKHEGELIWEYGTTTLDPSQPLVIEKEITGVDANNIILVMDFGGNPAETHIYIKDITLIDPSAPATPTTPSTIAEIIKNIPDTATGNDTAVEFEANLTSPAVVSYVNGNNAYIQDATGAFLIYLKDHGLKPGDTIKGKLSLKAYWFNGIPETVAIGTEYEKATGEAPDPKEVTIADLVANYDVYLLRLIVLKDVLVTGGIADGDRNGEVAQGDDKINVYAQLNNKGLVLTEGKKGDLVTIPGMYKTNKQVYFWQNDWFTEAAAATGITIDGDLSDWANIQGVSDGKCGMFKVTSDADNIYFYHWRTTEGRYAEIWGGSGYVYIAFDLDNNDTTGETLWGNGPYDFVGVIYPYGENNTINETPGDACLPETATLANVKCKGVVDAEGAKIEFSIPRADLPAIPTTSVKAWSWGNKDLSKVSIDVTL